MKSKSRKKFDPPPRAQRIAPVLPIPSDAYQRDQTISLWLITLMILLSLAGYAFLHSGIVMVGGNSLSVARALFSSVNAITGTGFQQSIAVDQMLWPGQCALMALTIAGSLITLIASALAVNHLLKLDLRPSRLAVAAVGLECAAILLGAIALLAANRHSISQGEAGNAVFIAMFNSASAFGNCGLALPYNTADAAIPSTASAWLVLMPLSVVGGLGLIACLDLSVAIRKRRRPMNWTILILAITAGTFIVGFAVSIWLQPPTSIFDSTGESLSPSFRQSIELALDAALNTRSAGFPIRPVFEHARIAQWFMMLMMIIGASPAGTGGGLRGATLVEIGAGVRRALRGLASGRRFAIAIIWFATYGLLAICVLGEWLRREPQLPGDRALFYTISAISNVGLSHDPLNVTADNSFLLCAGMLLGRILPIGFLWWMASELKSSPKD